MVVQGIQICSFSRTAGLLLDDDGGAGAWRWSSWWPDRIRGPHAHRPDRWWGARERNIGRQWGCSSVKTPPQTRTLRGWKISRVVGLLLDGVVPRCFRGRRLRSVVPPVGYDRGEPVATLCHCPTGHTGALRRNGDEGPTGATGDGSTGSALGWGCGGAWI
jgi:hypothetical protein